MNLAEINMTQCEEIIIKIKEDDRENDHFSELCSALRKHGISVDFQTDKNSRLFFEDGKLFMRARQIALL